ncbi:MAG: hypothetical protein J6Y74_03825 [Clostridia bacterium]|nr:hypothetical protein [Clostridia bacterium]
MIIKFLTPVQLWQDFDPQAAPLDMAIAYNNEEGDLRRKGVYFTAETSEEGQIRAFAEIKSSVAQPKRILVSVLTEPEQRPISDSFDELLKRGFAVVTVDVSGIPDQNDNAAKYPSAYAYASFAAGKPDRFLATPSAKHSPVFLWAKIVRRALTLLEYLYPKATLAVLGTLSAADVAWQVAAMDRRISALIALLGDYSEPPVLEEDSSNADSYIMALSAKSAARMVRCPCLVATSANQHGGDVKKIGEVIHQIPENVPYTIAVTPRLNGQIDEADLLSTYKWLDKALRGEKTPDLSLTSSQEDGFVRFVLHEPSGSVRAATLHVSYNNAPAEYRHWHEFPMKKQEDGTYAADVPVWAGDREVTSYATATISGGMTFAAKTVCTLVSSTRPYHTSQFLLDTASDHGFYSDNSGETFISHKDDFRIAECPNGVPGFAGKGVLRTNILSETGRYETASSLHISVYSKSDSTVRVCLMKAEDDRIIRYTALCEAEGEEWTRLSLETDDFKTEELIPMKDWEGLLGIILPDTDDKYYNNFLWM